MFAIEGPIASISVPRGVCSSIHFPASRPPGTPPVPARKDVEFVAPAITPQDVDTSHPTTAAVAPSLIARPARMLLRPGLRASTVPARKPAARAAVGPAIGSRY